MLRQNTKTTTATKTTKVSLVFLLVVCAVFVAFVTSPWAVDRTPDYAFAPVAATAGLVQATSTAKSMAITFDDLPKSNGAAIAGSRLATR